MFKKTSFLSLILLFILNVNAQNYIYVGDSGLNNLRKIDLDGNFIETIDEDINTPREIEVDYENGIIFYTNAFDDSSIRKYNIDSNEITFVISDLTQPSRLALDRDSQLIYYSEKTQNRVSKINYDGSNNEVILESSNGINQLEFDPVNQLLFFIDNSANMYKMNTSGENIELVSDELDSAHSFKLDYYNEKIYFSERGSSNSISVMNFDGSGNEVLFYVNDSPHSLDVDFSENKIYFATDSSLRSADMDGSNEIIFTVESTVPAFVSLEQDFASITSIMELNQENYSLVFPNPLSEGETLKIKTNKAKIKQVDIMDVKGFLNESLIIDLNTELIIDTDNLSFGTYILLIQYADGRMEAKKIIKR